jgi:hypothetical protein
MRIELDGSIEILEVVWKIQQESHAVAIPITGKQVRMSVERDDTKVKVE